MLESTLIPAPLRTIVERFPVVKNSSNTTAACRGEEPAKFGRDRIAAIPEGARRLGILMLVKRVRTDYIETT
jgi:hypothetical protein